MNRGDIMEEIKKEEEKDLLKKIKCYLCGKEYEVEEYISEPNCPDCFNGCCDPSYHQGEPCDKSC